MPNQLSPNKRFRGFTLEKQLDAQVCQMAAKRNITVSTWLREAIADKLERSAVSV